MCGIVGVYRFDKNASADQEYLANATAELSLRGPDAQKIKIDGPVGLGHARLSIIDTSDAGLQPMSDSTGRYTIIFNGEIYNYKQLQERFLKDKDIHYQSASDTEVLLYLYIYLGERFLQELNGFFGLAIYDNVEQTVFIARDRIGIKPMLIYQDADRVLFASEIKALLQFPIERKLNRSALMAYLQLNYVPAPMTMFQGIVKLRPGHFLTIKPDGTVSDKQYYKIPKATGSGQFKGSYNEAQASLLELLHQSVQNRLIADVPLGAFLSGGIDSSAIVAVASEYAPHISTFSIGYKDEPYFDETRYAELVAKKFNTNHTTFSLSNDDLYDRLFHILNYLDEPFADSSAIAVNILCSLTRNKVTVALSGDGADEMFSGYNKHYAEYRARQKNTVNTMMGLAAPVFAALPKSRNSKLGNIFRQLDRYASSVSLTAQERYWRWCSFVDEMTAGSMLAAPLAADETEVYQEVRQAYLDEIDNNGSFNDILYADMQLVLVNDMLTKVDSMSMANSLEVRVPFLDHHLVEFAFSLPPEFKLKDGFRKRIVKDTFRGILPDELYHRPKHGFEVPLLKWFRGDLRSLIEDDLLNDEFVAQQGVFRLSEVQQLKKQLFSNNPGESHARIWGLIVFQYWWKKYFV